MPARDRSSPTEPATPAMGCAAPLRLATLGRPSLVCAEEADDPDTPSGAPGAIGVGMPLALLVYLAAAPGRTARRDELVTLLWAESGRAQAQRSLRNTIARLRRRFGPDLLPSEDDRVATLGPTVVVDRDLFLAAAGRQDHETAVALYTGDFFPDFAAPGAAEFEQWAELERQRLRSTFQRCAEALVDDWIAAGRAREAAAVATRLRDLAPLHQRAWQLLLRALLAGREPTRAAVEADECERVLAREELEPERATRQALAAVRSEVRERRRVPETATEAQLVPELVGREQEFAAILAAWGRATAGQAAHVHLAAPAGLGKTRLVEDVRARLRARGARVVHLRAPIGAREVAYALAGELVHALAQLPGALGVPGDLAGALVALAPALAGTFRTAPEPGGDAAETLRRRAIAVRELLAAVAEEQPVALLVDDVHWADVPSRTLLHFLLGALEPRPDGADEADPRVGRTGRTRGRGGTAEQRRVLLLTAARPLPEGRLVSAITVELALRPLDPPQVAALVASVAELPEEPWARELPGALHRVGHGSPLLVLETLHLAVDRGVLVREAERWRAPDPGALATLLHEGKVLHRRLDDGLAADAPLLALLAAAGEWIGEARLARALDASSESLRTRLLPHEQRGLVVGHDERWRLAHDEHATAVRERAAPEVLAAAHRRLGEVLADEAGDDPRGLARAAQHLAAAGDAVARQRLFVRLVRLARVAGDRRPTAALARELAGAEATSTEVAALLASLPLPLRLGLVGHRPVAAAALGVALIPLMAAVAVVRRPAPLPAPDAVLVVAHPDSARNALLLHDFPVRRGEWTPGGGPLALAVRGAPRWRLPLSIAGAPLLGGLSNGPEPDSWVATWQLGDSTVSDLFLVTGSGRARRLTRTPGDDGSAEWAPDGSRLVFQTGSLHPMLRADVALLDTATGRITPLTRGDDAESGPRWSPDGTRIAFSRQHWDGRPNTVCAVTVDGADTWCYRPGGVVLDEVVGWADDRHLLARTRAPVASRLVRLEVGSGRYQLVDTLPGVWDASPDGQWLLCRCTRPGYPEGTWFVRPAGDARQLRPIHLTGAPASAELFWAGAPTPPRHLAHLSIELGEGGPVPAVPYQLRAVGTDPAGAPVRLNALTWRSGDTLVATVDSAGRLLPRRAGTVTITLSAGGWRTASRTVTVRAAPRRTALAERWTRGLHDGWIRYGSPRPRVVGAPDGSASFWTAGDGLYTSGVYAARTFSWTDGLGLDVRLSTPVTLGQWQEQTVGFFVDVDPRALAGWDHRTGYPPLHRRARGGHCFVRYPGGDEGHAWADSIETSLGRVAAPAALRSGAWFSARVQLFPDGRCGVAVNGRAVALGRVRSVSPGPAHLTLDGKSFGTRLLVGALTVFTGVPADVDWAAVDAAGAPRGRSPAP